VPIKRATWLSLSLSLAMVGCAPGGLMPAPAADGSVVAMLDCLATQASSPKAGAATVAPSDPYARFRLACQLGRDGRDGAATVRALRLLDGLEAQLHGPGEPELVGLYRHTLELRQQLRQQWRQTQEYRHKIEQLKGLELDLEAPPDVPSAVAPTPAPLPAEPPP